MNKDADETLRDQRLLPLLEHLARVGRRAAEASMDPGGLRPRHLIALQLLNEDGPTTQQGLTAALRLDPGNVVALLNDLEDRHLVTRRRDPADRRRHIVEISARGNQELCVAHTRLRAVEEALLGALSPQERATLHHLLVRAVGVTSPPCEVPAASPSGSLPPATAPKGSGSDQPGH